MLKKNTRSLLFHEEVGAPDNFVLRGNAWVFGDKIDADWQICPLDSYNRLKDEGKPLTAEELGKHCMENIEPDFAKKVLPGDIIVAGENFGYSAVCLDGTTDDPHFVGAATLAIQGAGIGAVLCLSSAINFMMNSIQHGLPVIEIKDIYERIRQGDSLEIDIEKGNVKNLSRAETYRFTPYPKPIIEMIRLGGLYPV